MVKQLTNHTNHSLNSSFILSAIILAIAKEDVAPGDGAFLQCNTLLPIAPDPGLESNTKSSINVPKIDIYSLFSPFILCVHKYTEIVFPYLNISSQLLQLQRTVTHHLLPKLVLLLQQVLFLHHL